MQSVKKTFENTGIGLLSIDYIETYIGCFRDFFRAHRFDNAGCWGRD